jgi:hypothetical protein
MDVERRNRSLILRFPTDDKTEVIASWIFRGAKLPIGSEIVANS